MLRAAALKLIPVLLLSACSGHSQGEERLEVWGYLQPDGSYSRSFDWTEDRDQRLRGTWYGGDAGPFVITGRRTGNTVTFELSKGNVTVSRWTGDIEGDTLTAKDQYGTSLRASRVPIAARNLVVPPSVVRVISVQVDFHLEITGTNSVTGNLKQLIPSLSCATVLPVSGDVRWTVGDHQVAFSFPPPGSPGRPPPYYLVTRGFLDIDGRRYLPSEEQPGTVGQGSTGAGSLKFAHWKTANGEEISGTMSWTCSEPPGQ
jgi:hypothetical protein